MLLKNNKPFKTCVVIIVILILFALLFLVFRPIYQPLLLTNAYLPDNTVVNWVISTGENRDDRQVGQPGIRAMAISPSGSQIFYTDANGEIWISDIDGSNLHIVYAASAHPRLELQRANWLTDDVLLINAIDLSENRLFLYELDVNGSSFRLISEAKIVILVSPNGEFWIQRDAISYEHEIATLAGETRPFSVPFVTFEDNSPCTFSPNGEQLAYLQRSENDPGGISLWIADINGERGIENPRMLLDDRPFSSILHWSPNGRLIGYDIYNTENDETRFQAIDIQTEEVVYDWPWPNRATSFFWSPSSDSVITIDGYLLDLGTGEVTMFFKDNPYPSYVVDWQLVRSRR